jgi:hypothetical protein
MAAAVEHSVVAARADDERDDLIEQPSPAELAVCEITDRGGRPSGGPRLARDQRITRVIPRVGGPTHLRPRCR